MFSNAGSLVVAHGLGILVPWQGTELKSPALEGRFSITESLGKFPKRVWTLKVLYQLCQKSLQSCIPLPTVQKLFPRLASPHFLDEWCSWTDVGLLFPCAYDNTGITMKITAKKKNPYWIIYNSLIILINTIILY